MIRYSSISTPLQILGVREGVANVLRHAGAMGLLQAPKRARVLDAAALVTALEPVSRSGIAVGALARLSDAEPKQLAVELGAIDQALLESPVPEAEWPRVLAALGVDKTAELVGISKPSVQRYKTGARQTPAEVALRLHFLALVVGELAGAYNPLGIRMWFDRKRAQLGGRSPGAVLGHGFDPDGAAAKRVRELAEALGGSPAT